MKLTERKLREFFPKDHRFIHYCANRFGYSFFNQEAVESAHYYSAINITRYIEKNGRMFEDEKHLVSVVMGSIRYGIMTAVSDKSRKASRKYKRSVDTITEADLYFNDDDNMPTKYDKACVSYDEQEDGTHMLIDEFKSIADSTEAFVFDEHIINGTPIYVLCAEHEYTESELSNAKKRIKTKFKNLIKDELHRLQDAQNITNYEAEVSEVSRGISEENGYKCLVEHENKERSYRKTMSFLYPEKKVWDENNYDWLVS